MDTIKDRDRNIEATIAAQLENIAIAKLLPLISDRLDILAEIDRLLTLKATANESTMVSASPILNNFIRSEIDNCEAAVKLMPKPEINSADLDRLFKQYAIGL